MAIARRYPISAKAALLAITLAFGLLATIECANVRRDVDQDDDGHEDECEPGNFLDVYQTAYNNQDYVAIRRIISPNVKLLTAAGVVIAGPTDYLDVLQSLYQDGYTSLNETQTERGKANKLAYIVSLFHLKSSNETALASISGLDTYIFERTIDDQCLLKLHIPSRADV